MEARVIRDGPLVVVDCRCDSGPADIPYPEVHARYSLSYVRRGSFGCRARGREHQLLTGSFLIGCPGEEFTCTHEHHGEGDECLSIQLTPALLYELTDRREIWKVGAVPPVAALASFGELAQAAASGRTGVGLVECALALVARFIALTADVESPTRVDARVHRVICRTADWIDANSSQDIDLLDFAREAGMSPHHFLRIFHAVLGLTPHQHLVRCRLRKAARQLLEDDVAVTNVALEVGFGDLSNFVRTFKRAAGVSPGRFRRLRSVDRKNLQDSLPVSWLAACL